MFLCCSKGNPKVLLTEQVTTESVHYNCEKEGEGTKRDTLNEHNTSEKTEVCSDQFSDILEDSIGRYHVRIFAEQKRAHACGMLDCLKDIQSFKASLSNRVRMAFATKICRGYSESQLSGGNQILSKEEQLPSDSVYEFFLRAKEELERVKEEISAGGASEVDPGIFRLMENMLLKNVELDLAMPFLNSRFYMRYKEAKKIREEAKSAPKTSDFKTLIPNLSSGGFCKVYACVKKNTGRVMALKVITVKTPGVHPSTKRPKNEGKPEKLKAVLAERDQLARIKSPFIVDLKYAMQLSRTKVALVFDLAEAGDLRMLMKTLPSDSGLPEVLVKFWAAEILMGLEALHSSNIIMRDLKSRNVLLDASGHARLCDLGLAAPCKQSMQSTSRVGTTGWMSPEVILMKAYDKRSDFFSYGILLYRMIANKHPFSGKHWQECESRYGNTLNKYACLEVEEYPKSVFPDKLKRMLYSGCMGKYAYERYNNCTQFKSHAWFKEIDFPKLEAGILEPPKTSLHGIRKKLREIREKVAQFTAGTHSFSDLVIDKGNEVVQRDNYEVEGITEHERNLRKLSYVNEAAVDEEIIAVCKKIDDPKNAVYNAASKKTEYYSRLIKTMYPPYVPRVVMAKHSTTAIDTLKRMSLSDSLLNYRREEGQEHGNANSNSGDYTSQYVTGTAATSSRAKRASSDDAMQVYRMPYSSKQGLPTGHLYSSHVYSRHHAHRPTKSHSNSLSLRKVSLSNVPTAKKTQSSLKRLLAARESADAAAQASTYKEDQ